MSISLHTGVSEIVPQHRVHHNDLPILRDICVVIRAVRAVFGLQGFYIGKGQRIAHQYRNRITVVRDRVASAFILTELRLLRLVHKLLALRVPEPHYQQLIVTSLLPSPFRSAKSMPLKISHTLSPNVIGYST